MKRQKFITVLSISFLLLLSTLAFAQQSNTDAFGKGTNVLSGGLGLGGSYAYIGGGYSSTPNFVLTYDNGTFNNVGPGIISLGGLLSYKSASYQVTYFGPNTNYNYTQNWNYFILGMRSAYHWNFTTSSRFDPYIGLMLAYYDISFSETSNDPNYKSPGDPFYHYSNNSYGGYVAFSLYLGARYYISNAIGIWLELGFGYSDAAFGISYKF